MTPPSARSSRIRLALAAALCAAALLASAAPALAADTATRSAGEIQARYQQLKPTYSGSPYAVAPNLTSPFATGTLANGLLQDGLDSINYARFLAGLPDDVVLDSANNDKAQHGAVLLAVGQFAHSQSQPAGMATDFYTIANGATSSSNIGWGYRSLWDFNVSCMGDEDTGNIDRIGHRRWILNPPLLKTGMGLANTSTDTYVFDWSRTSAVAYDAIKWPSAGFFPAEMFSADVPWSITLNPSLYSWTTGTAGHTVTLRRVRDGKTWTFTSADTNKSAEYFNFETSGYGVADCFIFRPDPKSVGSYQVGDSFDVTLTGGITRKADNSAATISYRTTFMSQTGHDGTGTPVPAPTPPPTTTETGTVGTTTQITRAPTSVKVHRTLQLVGTVTPAAATGWVTIAKSRQVNGKWRGAGSASVSVTGGRFSYTFRPTVRGKWRFVATYGGATGATTAYTGSKSAAKGVRVK